MQAKVISLNTLSNNREDLMSKNTKIGIVTAAGYDEAERYYGRLHGLLDAIKVSEILSTEQKKNIVIMGRFLNTLLKSLLFTLPHIHIISSLLILLHTGGESNFLFTYDPTSPWLLSYLPRRNWILPEVISCSVLILALLIMLDA